VSWRVFRPCSQAEVPEVLQKIGGEVPRWELRATKATAGVDLCCSSLVRRTDHNLLPQGGGRT
jgi:hypothetical protein